VLASSVGWTTLGAVASRGCFLLTALLMARVLGKAGYGQWGIVDSTVVMLAQYGAMGMGKTATKHVAELRRAAPGRGGDVLSFLFLVAGTGLAVMAVVCAAAAPLLASRVYRAESLAVPLACAALYLISMTGTYLLQAVLAGFGDYRAMASINVVQGVLLPVLVAPLTWGWGLSGAVLAIATSYGAALGLTARRVRQLCREHDMPITLSGAKRETGLFWSYCLPLSLAGGIAVPASWFVNTYTSRVVGFGALGGYMAADRFRGLLMFIPTTVKQVSLPMLSEMLAAGDARRFRRVLWANLGVNVGLTLAGAVPAIALSPWLMSWFGPQFRDEWPMLVVLVLSATAQAAANVLAQVTACSGKTWLNFAFSTTFGIVLVTVTLACVPRLGALGLAIGMLAAQSSVAAAHGGLSWWLLCTGRLFPRCAPEAAVASGPAAAPLASSPAARVAAAEHAGPAAGSGPVP
jgi:O-antigen/teichoic acid export membrane protein